MESTPPIDMYAALSGILIRKAAQLEEASSDDGEEQKAENSYIHVTGDMGVF